MVTLAQVAQRANVTAATVSNVLRNPQKVKPATVERVMAAIRELGYRPNLTARALAEGRTSTLALMLSNITNPFYPEFVLAAEREARKRGHYLLVSNTDDDPAITRNYLERIAGTLAAGAIVMNTDLAEAELADIARHGASIVLCMWEHVHASRTLPCVTVDFAAAGRWRPRICPGCGIARSARWSARGRAVRSRCGCAGSPTNSRRAAIRPAR